MGNEVTIRPYRQSDRQNVRRICVATGPAWAAAPGEKQDLLLAAYCDYYIEREPEHCFVAANGKDEAVGYILCAADAAVWAQRMRRDYFPRVDEAGRALLERSLKGPLAYAAQYPAHLHIDISPDYQRMGLGTKLMDALIAHLRAAGVPGVMFGVSADNEGAIRFYQKYGFCELERGGDTVVMGMGLR